MKTVYERPSNVLTNEVFTTCGGCGHGIVFKLIAEVIEENGWEEKSIIVWPIGCSSFGYKGISLDGINALHGRAPAVATGLKRATDDKIVIVYQGDGDMVSEGLAEIMSAAARSEKISVIFVNNAIFGMTGGQMAATSLENMVTSTSPFGRNPDVAGYPINMSELISNLKGCYYAERAALSTPANIKKTKKSIERVLKLQQEGKGLSFLEILSPCPTNWGMKPVQCLEWIENEMVKQYPLGVFKDNDKEVL